MDRMVAFGATFVNCKSCTRCNLLEAKSGYQGDAKEQKTSLTGLFVLLVTREGGFKSLLDASQLVQRPFL